MDANEQSPQIPMQSMNWLSLYPTTKIDERSFLDTFSSQLGNYPNTQDITLAVFDAKDTGFYKGKKLSDKELKLLADVSEFITTGVALGLDEAVDIRNRQITEKEILQEFLTRSGDLREWSFFSGDYQEPFVEKPKEVIGRTDTRALINTQSSTEEVEREISAHEKAGDTVEFITRRLRRLLEKKTDAPVVMVDIGGMYGTTMLELASVFPQEIREGKLVLIVTNLTLDKEKIDLDALPKNGTGLPTNYIDLFKQNADLVHFILSDVQQLMGRKLTLANGTEFRFEQSSCDILHESWSISTNSKILEKEAEVLAELVGNQGIILSRRADRYKRTTGVSTPIAHGYKRQVDGLSLLHMFSNARYTDYEDMKKQTDFTVGSALAARMSAVAHNLRAKGLREVTSVFDAENREHALNYVVWIGTQTEPLDIVDYKGDTMLLEPKESADKKSKNPINYLERLIEGIKNL